MNIYVRYHNITDLRPVIPPFFYRGKPMGRYTPLYHILSLALRHSDNQVVFLRPLTAYQGFGYLAYKCLFYLFPCCFVCHSLPPFINRFWIVFFSLSDNVSKSNLKSLQTTSFATLSPTYSHSAQFLYSQ